MLPEVPPGERQPGPPRRRTCPSCSQAFDAAVQFCPHDGSALSASAPHDPLLGRVVGERYRLEARLGSGAMGTVYRALHTHMDKPVAVKLLRTELAGNPEAVARFQREARSASRLDHEHCIRVSDFGQSDEGLLYLVMDLLDGESLAQRIERGPLAPSLAAAVAHDVALALGHAHEQGIIHRDLKPDNILLARRGRRLVVKVLDFGLAKIAGERGSAPTLTRAGAVFGTPAYMAPEQAQGLPLGPRSDLYSLGVLLYEMLTGGPPFRAEGFIALLSQHVEETPEPPRARRPDLDLPEALEEVVLRCLAKEPAERFPDANTLAEALRPLADWHGLELSASSSSAAPSSAAASTGSAPEPASAWRPPEPASDRPPVLPAPEHRAPDEEVPAKPPSMAEVHAAVDEEQGDYGADEAQVGDEGLRPRRRGGWPGRVAVVALLGMMGAMALTAYRWPWRGTGAAVVAGPSGGVESAVAQPESAPSTHVEEAAVEAPVGPARAKPTPPKTNERPADRPQKALDRAQALLAKGQLDEAAAILASERARGDGARLQLLLGDLAERHDNRLRALAHLYRATRLEPKDPEPHLRLAALLRRLGQGAAACQQALAALALAPESAEARAATKDCEPPHHQRAPE